MARCVTCSLQRQQPHGLVATEYADVDLAAYDHVQRRTRSGRPTDMPSRADRNRARRLVHRDGMAWILSWPSRRMARRT